MNMSRSLLFIVAISLFCFQLSTAQQQCVAKKLYLQKVNNETETYTQEQIYDHLGNSLVQFQWADELTTTFHCIDARSTDWLIGTPGGDFAEFMVALTIYSNITGREFNYTEVRDSLKSFIDYLGANNTLADRHFFFHTDDEKVSQMLSDIGQSTSYDIHNTPPVADQPDFFQAIVQPQYQGCSHVKYMIQYAEEYHTNTTLMQNGVKAFFDLLWNFPEKSKLDLDIWHGPQTSQAAIEVIVNGTCKYQTPMVLPKSMDNTTSVFAYHYRAANDYRKEVIAQFFATELTPAIVDTDDFYHKIVALADDQFFHTVEKLVPHIPIYKLTIEADYESNTPTPTNSNPPTDSPNSGSIAFINTFLALFCVVIALIM